jgi:pimeloyl-ACP methyl ester carboxylesterase
VLIGHDWGAVATYAVTAAEPSRFSRYVTLAVPPPPAILAPFRSLSTLPLAARQARMSWYFLFNQLPVLSERSLDSVIPKLWQDWSPGYDAAEDLARVFDALRGAGRRRAAQRYYRNNLQKGIKATFTLYPKAPVLYLHGERDGCMQGALVERYPGTLLPAGSRFGLVEGVGHFMQLEDPARINAAIVDWIAAR